MSSSTFSVGDLVWAKMKGYSPWPARITTPPNLKSLAKQKKGHQCCYFFGSENYSWILDEHISKHSESMIPKTMKRQSAQFREAVNMIIQQSMAAEDDEVVSTEDDEVVSSDDDEVISIEDDEVVSIEDDEAISAEDDEVISEEDEEVIPEVDDEVIPEEDDEVIPEDDDEVIPEDDDEVIPEDDDEVIPEDDDEVIPEDDDEVIPEDDDEVIPEEDDEVIPEEDDKVIPTEDNYEEMQPSTSGIASKLKILKEKMETSRKRDSDARKRSRGRNSSPENSEENKFDKNVTNPKKKKRVEKSDEEKRSKRTNMHDDENSHSSSMSNGITYSITSDEESPDENLSFVPGYYPDSVPKCIERPTYVERPPTPEFNINEVSEVIRAREVIPVSQKFGFLGLGFMGRILAKHFLHCGHYLTVWNRSPEKCDEFVAAGARRGQTAADVVTTSDITFCCLSDTEAVRSIVFDKHGVLEGMDRSVKGFCVLNTITPFASVEINDAISSKGGLYLEAFIHGTRSMAENGTLLIIAGGSHDLFHDCCSCFRSIAKDVYYVNYDIGEAAIVNIFVNLLNACVVNALAGAMSFVSKNEGSMSQFTELLRHSRANSNAMIKNANAIAKKDFSTDISMKYMLQSLTSALELTNTVYTPTYISSLVREQYKNASMLRYFDHDASAVFQAM